jgi:hypothetical protein
MSPQKQHIAIVVAALFLAASMLACDLGAVTPAASKPVVTIASPPNGAQVALGQEVLVQTSAVDQTGIARVELWVDGALSTIAQPTSPQSAYEVVLRWTPATLGVHMLMAKAINASGVASEPAVVAVSAVSLGSLEKTPAVPTNTSTPLIPAPTTKPPTPKPPTSPTGCTMSIDFRADRTTINAGEHATLRWDVECVQAVYLDGAPVTGHETRDIAPSATTTYTLHVIKKDGSAEDRQVIITVNPAPPACVNFSVSFGTDQQQIPAGTTTTLRWKVECVKAVYLQMPYQAYEPVVGEGSRQVGIGEYHLKVILLDGSEKGYVARVIAKEDPVGIKAFQGPTNPGNPNQVKTWVHAQAARPLATIEIFVSGVGSFVCTNTTSCDYDLGYRDFGFSFTYWAKVTDGGVTTETAHYTFVVTK